MKSFFPSSFIHGTGGFCFLGGVSRDGPPWPVGRGGGWAREVCWGVGVSPPADPCSGWVWASSRCTPGSLWPPLLCLPGPRGREGKGSPGPGRNAVSVAGRLKGEALGVTLFAFGRQPVLWGLSRARNFWRDSTLGTFCSGHG